jgi:4-hydroxybenzoate polyprenyltransferase
MVRFWKYTIAFFKLIRIQNLIIIALTMFLLRWFVVIPLLGNLYFESQLSSFNFILLVLATTSIAAAGYIINDYFDRKTDLINRPGRVILGRILKLRTGMVWHFILSGLGIALGVLLSHNLGNIRLSILFVGMSGLLWFYSTTYKRQVLLGNLIVAFMVAAVPLILLFYELPLINEKYRFFIKIIPTNIGLMIAWIIGYALFAFLLTFVREIIKDLEDFEGDAAFGRNTIPITWGPLTARRIIFVVLIIILFFLGIALLKFRWSIPTLGYGLILIFIPLIFTGVLVYFSDNKIKYHRASQVLKLIMIAGLLFNIIARYTIF